MVAGRSYAGRKRRLGGIPFMGVFSSMTLALFILGIFGMLVLLARSLSEALKEQVEIQVFLRRNITENERITLRSTLAAMDFVAKSEGRPAIRFVSRDSAALSFSKEIGEDFVRYIGENPLSDLFIIRMAPAYQNPRQFRIAKAKIESLRGVMEAAYVEQLVGSIYDNLGRISILLLALIILLFVAVVMIMNHAIRLSLFSQRFLIRSMQLVGATDGFIKRPFLLRATLYGLFAAVVAVAVIYGLLNGLERFVPHLSRLGFWEQFVQLAVSLLFVGMLTSYVSTRRAVSRYLRMSLDELY